MRSNVAVGVLVAYTLCTGAVSSVAQAQRSGHCAVGSRVRASAEMTIGATMLNGRPQQGGYLTEGYVTRPVVSLAASSACDVVSGHLELNLEGLTLLRGELNPGIYGEGYYDRRHPHTLFHDAVATMRTSGDASSRARMSVTAGRGFAPFGTDDPMSRPFLKFPTNHHLAQLLERVVAIGAVGIPIDRRADLAIEAGLFNGDDPIGPFAAPQWRRFSDSWSTRATIAVRRSASAIEVQGSYADVRSPDIPRGGGLDQRKTSVSARLEDRSSPLQRYVLAEFATTSVYDGATPAFEYSTWLAEGSLRRGRRELALRVERTDRPEDERQLDPFRSPRPPHDFMNLGITRWSTASTRLSDSSTPLLAGVKVSLTSFVEAAIASPRQRLTGSLFDPQSFYGRSRIWTVTIGARFGIGSTAHARMGRYGAAAVPSVSGGVAHDHM